MTSKISDKTLEEKLKKTLTQDKTVAEKDSEEKIRVDEHTNNIFVPKINDDIGFKISTVSQKTEMRNDINPQKQNLEMEVFGATTSTEKFEDKREDAYHGNMALYENQETKQNNSETRLNSTQPMVNGSRNRNVGVINSEHDTIRNNSTQTYEINTKEPAKHNRWETSNDNIIRKYINK